jgi:hypothetical protein
MCIMTNAQQQYVLDVLGILDAADLHDCPPLFWRVRADRVTFSVLCNDLFADATADLEVIDPVDVPLLRGCIADLEAAEQFASVWWAELFASRKRGMPPKQWWRNRRRAKGDMSEAVLALFEACESPWHGATWEILPTPA